eukprot:TRINITY_DN68195_c2_g3_i5.p2 TRINITY_DN68195_c2_g3~~TRINITY_DN68195_c2_g3_i5.p2  ORF type:complete len:162 (-),score=27.41 TRINITY_DN68195_c2_g3_i5:143-628(-)
MATLEELNQSVGYAMDANGAVVGIDAMSGDSCPLAFFGRPGRPLHWAIAGAHASLVEQLLDMNVDPTAELHATTGLMASPQDMVEGKKDIKVLFGARTSTSSVLAEVATTLWQFQKSSDLYAKKNPTKTNEEPMPPKGCFTLPDSTTCHVLEEPFRQQDPE